MANGVRALFNRIKTESKHEGIKLRHYQEALRQRIIDERKHLMVCWTRRAGKDLFTFTMAYKQCLEKPNSRVYYFLPTAKQCKLVLTDGVLNDGRNFLTSIVDVSRLTKTIKGNIIHSDNTIHFDNGSIIYLFGADTGDSKVGGNADLIVFSEAGPMGPKFQQLLNKLLPSTGLVGGRIIAVSTPRYGSFFNQMFNDSEVDSQWIKSKIGAYDLYDDDQVRIYSDSDLDKIKITMSEEEFAQEYLADTCTHNTLSIYGKSLETAKLIDFKAPTPQELLYISLDLGISDSTVLTFAVQRKGCVEILGWYENNNQPTKHYVDYIKNFCRANGIWNRNIRVILPHDSRNRLDTGESIASRAEFWSASGFSVEVLKPIPVLKTIECLRAAIQHGDIAFANVQNVRDMMAKLKGYEWQSNASGEVAYVPNHGKYKSASNTADSLEYMCLYFFFKKYINENEINHTFKGIDTLKGASR